MKTSTALNICRDLKKAVIKYDKLLESMPDNIHYKVNNSILSNDPLIKLNRNEFFNCVNDLIKDVEKVNNEERTGKNTAIYTLYTYDLIDNAVNDRFQQGNYELKIDYNNNNDLINALKKHGIIKKTAKNSKIEIDGDDDTIYIDYKGIPEMELRKI